MSYDSDIHHRRSIRLRHYDYAAAGAYFVTICVQERESLFGTIAEGVMRLNDAGRMVADLWAGLPARFPDLNLDEYAVMPNHFHGILVLTGRRGEPCVRPQSQEGKTTGDHKDRENPGDHKDRPYGTRDGSIGRIMQAFKSLTTHAYIYGVTHHQWQPFPGRLWQRNYYEHVIRDEAELHNARQYIVDNPLRWEEDTENPAKRIKEPP